MQISDLSSQSLVSMRRDVVEWIIHMVYDENARIVSDNIKFIKYTISD